MARRFFRHYNYNKIAGTVSAAALTILLCSCSGADKTASSQSFVFDTYSQITVCGNDSEDVLSEVGSILSEMSGDFDLCYDMTANELPQNDLYCDCLSKTRELNRRYGNGINVFCGKLTKLWGISTDSPRVPADEELAAVLAELPDALTENIPYGAMLDFGAVSKGYACDKVFEVLEKKDMDYGIISLSSTTLMYGKKHGGKPFRTGLTNPLTGEGYAGIIETEAAFISTSGGYERYFSPEGTNDKYCHIMDMTTGRPVETDFASATVIVPADVTDGGILSDFLATMIFSEGTDNIDKWLACDDFQVVAISADGGVYSNCEGLELNESGGFYYEYK